MRQRSAQMLLEELNSIACPLALIIVARMSSRCEAPVDRACFATRSWEPRCMYCASWAVHLHAHRSTPCCVGLLVVLGEVAVLL